MQSSFLGSLWQGLTGSNDQSTKSQHALTQSNEDDLNREEGSNEESTPKAQAEDISIEVPTFALSEHDLSDSKVDQATNPTLEVSTSEPGPKMPSTTSQRTTVAAQAPPITSLKAPTAGLMPPPTKASTQKQSLPAPSNGLRVPSNGPLPNRGPPSNSQQRAGSSGRGKVLLAPGHSPMDWASLSRSKDLSGVPTLQRVTPSQMKVMNGRKGKPIWSSWQGKVYNITPYLPFHPGGEKELMKAAGRDGTKLFMDIHPWVNWEGMLNSCIVGILVSEEEATSSLDSLD